MADLSKDRKKSAHWTEADTSILVTCLMRHKDTGRTQDNGFKPEVWKEAADLVKDMTTMGGPKTPDACKSRWQRLQRDFKAVKELELLPNFTWDKTTHKLRATPDAWKAAEKTAAEVNKTQKVHLPAYDQLCILCPAENPRLRQRSVGKPRSSLGAHSDSSSMISVGNPQTPQMGLTTPMGPNGQLLELTMSNGLMPWDDISDETDYEGSFTINGQVITLDRGQKRMATFDSSMLGESNHLAQGQLANQLDPKPSPPKRPRTTSGDMLSDRSDQTGHRHQTHMAYNILPPGSPGFNGLGALMGSPTQTLTSASASLQAGSHAPRQDLSGAQQMHHHLRHDDHMKPLNHYMPQHDQMSHPLHHPLPQDFRYAVPTRPTPPPPSQRVSPAHPDPPTRNITPHQSLPPPPPQPSQATVAQTNSPTTYSPPAHSHRAQVQAAGLTEAQRRTEAILQLQTKDGGMPDEDLVEVLAEFETNVAAADTYLAIQREGLRKLWLGKVIKKRRGR